VELAFVLVKSKMGHEMDVLNEIISYEKRY
jgi:hypothetical protein